MSVDAESEANYRQQSVGMDRLHLRTQGGGIRESPYCMHLAMPAYRARAIAWTRSNGGGDISSTPAPPAHDETHFLLDNFHQTPYSRSS